jgi:inner membrane protein
MDTITHSLAGAVLGRDASDRTTAVSAMIVGAIGAFVPDLDFLLIRTRIDYLKDHRSWTHSFLVLPFLALAIALLVKIFARRVPLARLWLFAAIGILSHIVFDWITSFGTMFFTPVSRVRYALDWVFILDPIFTLISLATLVLAIIMRDRARAIALRGSAILAAYILFCGAMHARALALWRRMDPAPDGARSAVLPQFLSPFRWLGLSEHEGEVHAAFFDIGPFATGGGEPRTPKVWADVLPSLWEGYPPPERAKVRSYARATASPALDAARRLSDWSVYLAFARFPLETVEAEPDGGSTVIVQDLRFLPWFTGPWERGGEQGMRRQPFVYRVRLDSALRAVDRGFVRDGRP